jgi:sulfite reductase (NADPH) flavoprotein alpha-component
MAGLGTGAAPFRAFLQHLALLSSQGQEIGPVYYYFGSRHQASEYLYGEEIEAFILDGVVTRAGLAFSRDGAKKVYIQHKMLEDSEALAQMLHDDKGVFYLCGPTWPVPDVYEALVDALVKYKGSDPVKAGDYLESLKEEERYVLEVRSRFVYARASLIYLIPRCTKADWIILHGLFRLFTLYWMDLCCSVIFYAWVFYSYS